MRAHRVVLQLALAVSGALPMPVAAQAPAAAPAAVPAPSSTATATPAVNIPPCAATEHRQFDFWLGEWTVYGSAGKNAGKVVGRSRIEAILGGCVVAEHWSSGSGAAGDGKSFNAYNAGLKRWEQFWVDASGSRLVLHGGIEDGAMVLAGEQAVPDARTGIARRERITWTPSADGSVRQHWESSADAGKTWTTTFDGLYRRVATP
jgi:hypothetical protein